MPSVLEAVELLLVLHADQPRALLAHRQRLVLDDREQPPVRGRRIEAVRAPEEDLERALVGVLRVGRAPRVAARDAQQRLGVLGDRRHHEVLRRRRPATAGTQPATGALERDGLIDVLHDRHEGDPPGNSPPSQRHGPVSDLRAARAPRSDRDGPPLGDRHGSQRARDAARDARPAPP
jgi:hypothetical protein